jgi:RND superfamily putative drug exporter
MSQFARWIVVHRRGVVTSWIGAIVGLVGLLVIAGTSFSSSTDIPPSEAKTGIDLLAQVGATATTSGTVVWKTTGSGIADAAVIANMTDMIAEIEALPGVVTVASPYATGAERQINAAANTAYATVATTNDVSLDAVSKVVHSYDAPTLQVEVGGAAFTTVPGGKHGAEGVGMIAALVLLYVMFRAKRVAALPLVTGVAGVASSLLAVMLASHIMNIPDAAVTMGALIGLGVGIDYSLFIVNRFRKALMTGKTVVEAVAESLNSSGRAVMFAGATVIIALASMFLLGMPILTAMAWCAAVTVLFTVFSALTLLPSLLSILGVKTLSKAQRVELASYGSVTIAPHRRSLAWVAAVRRRPVAFAAAALAVILVLATPVLSMHIGRADSSADSVGTAGRSYYDMITPAFGAGFDATVVVVASTPDAASGAAFESLVSQLAGVDGVVFVNAAPWHQGQAVAVAAVIPATSAQEVATEGIVKTIRHDLAPIAQTGTDLRVYVTGTTAANMDIAGTLLGNLPLYLAVISVFGFALLAAGFRSLMVPLIGVVTNLFSIAVGIGAAVAVFQFGWGSSLFGVGGGAPIIYLIPVLVAGVVFGLAMDYQVFLVSRMHEEWVHTRDHARALRVGLSDTAPVIATAALIMISVFASFAFSGDRIVSAFGVGLAVAVAIDAFVVRLTLVPALIRLLGTRTWSYPEWAEAITPQLSIEGETSIDIVDFAVPVPVRVGGDEREE